MEKQHIPKNVVIIGAGGHARVVADIVVRSGDKVKGFLDGVNPYGNVNGIPVLGADADYKKFTDCYFIVAIGNADVRKRIAESMDGVKWYTAIHPNACISCIDTEIGVGSTVMANATVNTGVKIGKHCIINSNSVVEHDDVLGDYIHISVGTQIAGTVKIGNMTWVGIGATVSNGLNVCEKCMIGAGAVVVRDIKESGTYVGVPAKKIK